MANNLPIYATLLKDCDDKDLSSVQKTNVIKKIHALNDDGMELVYAIISIYAIENDPSSQSTLPFGCKFDGQTAVFNLDSLPNQLKQALIKFVNIHSKVMGESS